MLMKSMTKQKLADKAGVSLNTLNRWCKPYKKELEAMGLQPKAKAGVSLNTLNRWCKPYKKELEAMGLQPKARLLPPVIVKFIADKLCIDL